MKCSDAFSFGTPVRPLRGDDFDIDLVCKLSLGKDQTTQKELKNSVGSRLRQDPELSNRLEERRRCWTLKYGRKFHLDVLPSIPDLEGTQTSILLTDRELTRWQHSNPIGYADWFFSRMGNLLLEQQQRLAADAGIDVAEVPHWRIRTPLQRGIQLLKRHRDVTFRSDADNCPASIIATTQAAQSYAQERDLYSALLNMVRRMPRHIENRNGRWWIPNPAHPDENFADKWNEVPGRRQHFLGWLARVERDLLDTSRLLTDSESRSNIAKAFGVGSTSLVTVGAAVPALASESHVQLPPWTQRPTYRCEVSGRLYPKIRKGKALWQLSERAVPKHVGLRFEAKTNTPPPFVVEWQVTNTGQEAAEADALRGRFEDGGGLPGDCSLGEHVVRWHPLG